MAAGAAAADGVAEAAATPVAEADLAVLVEGIQAVAEPGDRGERTVISGQ